MMVVYPPFIIKELFYKTAKDCEPVRTSQCFLHKGKCPICNDYKKRMYVKQYPDNHYHIYCHNCGFSSSFYFYIKNHFEEYLHQLQNYYIDYLKNEKKENNSSKTEENNAVDNNNTNDEHIKKIILDIKLSSYIEENAFSLNQEQQHPKKEYIRNYAINYLTKRKIQHQYWKDFVFFYKGPMKGYIGIPMWDESRTLIHIQGRLLLPSKNKTYEQPKYIFLKDSDAGIENIPKPIYGLWRANKENYCYLSEGTLSCLAFGDQGLSTCGANISISFLEKVKTIFPKRIWSFDNYWIDTTARKKTNFLLNNGEICFVIPKNIPCKDTNDLINYMPNWETIPEDFIMNNIYSGKTGLIKLKLAS